MALMHQAFLGFKVHQYDNRINSWQIGKRAYMPKIIKLSGHFAK